MQRAFLIFLAVLLGGCALTDKAPALPYPAFIQTDELPDIFMAQLPGVRAKQYIGDMRTRTTSNRVDIPAEWKGTTGGAPAKSLEIFVLSGELTFSDIVLKAGGYAYVPPGSLGFSLHSASGARILYFLDDVPASAVIRAPLILDAGLLSWESAGAGVYRKVLREDPGSGATTWLERIVPGGVVPWQASSSPREGYLVSGEYSHSECFQGQAQTWTYTEGGYFSRPADVINGGPAASAATEATWFFREQRTGDTKLSVTCGS